MVCPIRRAWRELSKSAGVVQTQDRTGLLVEPAARWLRRSLALHEALQLISHHGLIFNQVHGLSVAIRGQCFTGELGDVALRGRGVDGG